MLKVECPKCKQWLHSNLLLEKKETTCPTCNVKVDVDELYISAGPYSISRDVLRKHFFKYKRLLTEAFKELEELKSESADSKAYKVTEDNVATFISNLKEMLEGCREGYRVFPENQPVEVTIGDKRYESQLGNVSITGICIKLEEGVPVPVKGDKVGVDIKSNGFDIALDGTVVWVRDTNVLGLRFEDFDKVIEAALVGFIESIEE
ncbi:MAG: PilZ domain-containing protein [Proteobacteria bacterium]|nr:PilZ domain-containing protein [Pseudomonadota bacterium]